MLIFLSQRQYQFVINLSNIPLPQATDFVQIVMWSRPPCGGAILKVAVTFAMRVAFISETILAQHDLLKDQKTTEW